MINPYLVYSSHVTIIRNEKNNKVCEQIMASADPIKGMQAYCNEIYIRINIEQERLKKEQVKFNKERSNKLHESKKSKAKGRKKRSISEANSITI
jgi:hypothetical protein